MLSTFETPQLLEVYVNDKIIHESNPDPQESLISLLRRNGFSGVKLGCSEGGCGSCTVLATFWDYKQLRPVSISINSCLAPALSMHKKHVLTIEGLSKDGILHKTQLAVANANGSQCGFCTPGIVMSLFAEVTINPHPTQHSIEDAFDGNLCRCTGYRPILDGAKSLACAGNSKSCPTEGSCGKDIEDLVKPNYYDFPTNLLKYHQELKTPVSYIFKNQAGFQFVHPKSKTELVQLFNQYPSAKIINGNTEVGIETRFKNLNYQVLINSFDIFDMKEMEIKDNGVEFGALTTVAIFQSRLMELVKKLPESQTRGFAALLENIKYFAGRQIRNVSAISGNICTASPISDLNPVLVALGAILTLESVVGGTRKLPISEFFLGYRKTDLKKGEVLTSVFVPYTTTNHYAGAFKQAKRRDDDIAIVNAGFLIELQAEGSDIFVKSSCFAFGGMGAFTLAAKKTSEFIKGKLWCDELLQSCYALLLEDLPLSSTSPGGQIEFRKTLAQSFFLKFSLRVNYALSKLGHREFDKKMISALQEIPRELSRGEQVYQASDGDGYVGKPIVHLSAIKQVTGEAVYVDDIPKFHNELYAIIVGSTVSHGYIESVDISLAEKAPGYVGWVSKNDCPPADEHGDPNMIGPVVHDEELFATNEVHCVGQMIGLVLANSEAEARYAAKLVRVTYKKLPSVFTIEDAIKANSFFAGIRKIETGEFNPRETTKAALPLSAATNFVEGVARMSAQEHFYLETNVSLCVPQEDGEMEIYASTQQAKETQDFAAHILQVPYHKVVVRVKRLGGGFGGKESRSVFLSTGLALAAKKYKRPVRSMLSREEDMVVTGTRHPFRGEYKVGFTNEGILVSLELKMFANAGYSVDLSWAVMERSMTHCDNAYKIPNIKIHGKICKTNTATNTAFRGFGGPQGMMVAEQYITHIASYLDLPVEHVRRINLYKNGDITHYDMPLENVFLDRAWEELMESSQFKNRKQEVAEFNRSHKYRKRGIAFMPTKFGLAFTVRHMNQAAALVHVYTDGSVRISHGGTEMGQGLHTKMVQITADALNIPINMVFLSETRTDIVINASPTAASVSSDINGMALKNACDQILERLKPVRELDPSMTWAQLVKKAYLERINLTANGFYKTPDLTFDWNTCKGRMFSYFTYGVACTEVEIDTLTGDHVVLSSHMIMDIGTPINPAIDVGQIEGAFTQGQGWCTIEEPLVSPVTGVLLTRGPGLYKIPGFKDIPVDFRVTVMDGVRNSRAIHSSKAVGEPPFFLGASVFFAIREAINSARLERGMPGYFRLDCPATSERIRIACKDEFVERAATPLKDGELCWGVPL